MSQHLDSHLMSVGLALSRKQIDIDGAMQMLSAPGIIDQVDGSNVQQLIRLSLMTAQMDSGSATIAEVGVLLSILKPKLEIDFGLQVGVANAQSCALFAMHSIALQQGNLSASFAILQNMIPSLKNANDRKGLLEVLCWLGVLHEQVGDYANAGNSLSAAVGLLDDPETVDALLDNSAIDMVRADNKNVFSFPMLKFFQTTRSADLATALREFLNTVEAKRRP